MELHPTNTHCVGDIIAYRCRNVWTTARVTKVNRASIRIEDGELSESNTFVPNFTRNTTNKGCLQLRGRRIYKYVRPSIVSEVREVVELYDNDEESSVNGTEHDGNEPMTEILPVSNISLHHPGKGPLKSAIRIGDYSRILASGRKAGCSGYTIEEIRRVLSEWRDDGESYIGMHYSPLDSRKILRFIKTTEEVEDFAPLIIGREKEGTVAKCAMLHIPSQSVIFRTATKGEPTRRAFDTHNENWKVETGLFTADHSFWHELRSHTMFSLVPY